LTIAGGFEQIAETVSTLRFGERARQLKTRPKINISCLNSAQSISDKIYSQADMDTIIEKNKYLNRLTIPF
jgi:hypothetical protein